MKNKVVRTPGDKGKRKEVLVAMAKRQESGITILQRMDEARKIEQVCALGRQSQDTKEGRKSSG